MSLRDIELELPNGFHDAKVTAISRDLNTDSLRVEVDILVGLPDDVPTQQDRFRGGTLTFEGVRVMIFEEPDITSSFTYPGPVNFVLTEDEAGSISEELLSKLRGEYHTYIFFVQDWLSNIKIAAEDLKFSWLHE